MPTRPLETAALARELASLRELSQRVEETDNPFSAHLDDARLAEGRAGLLARGEALLPPLLALLDAPEAGVRAEAARVLGDLPPGPGTVGAWLEGLSHARPEVRAASCSGLARSGGPHCGALLPLLRDADAEVVQAALGAAFALDPARALAAAAPFAGSQDPKRRRALCLQLGREEAGPHLGHEGAALLSGLVLDADDSVRRAAVLALCVAGSEAASEGLLGAFRGAADDGARRDALCGLVGLTWTEIMGDHPGCYQELPRALAPALAGAGFELRRRALQAFWRTDDPGAAEEALRGAPGSLEQKLPRAGSGRSEKKREARRGGGGGPAGLLRDLDGARDDAARFEVLGRLRGARTPEVARALGERARRRDAPIREALFYALSSNGLPEALEALRVVASDPEDPLAACAAMELLEAGDDRAIPDVAEVVHGADAANARRALSLLLARHAVGADLLEPLLAWSEREAPDLLHLAVIDALRTLGGERGRAALERYARGANARLQGAAKAALGPVPAGGPR